MPRVLPLFLAIALVPTAAAALTVQEVVALSQAGVSESVMLAMIERDKAVVPLDASQVIALQRDGVSERVVMALLKSGREDASVAPAVSTTAASLAPVEPLVVGVGHGPERPNTFHHGDALGVTYVGPVPVILPSLIPLVYSAPFADGRRLRTLPACTTGNGPRASGSRAHADAVNCRRVR